jgi:hypothetical protein
MDIVAKSFIVMALTVGGAFATPGQENANTINHLADDVAYTLNVDDLKKKVTYTIDNLHENKLIDEDLSSVDINKDLEYVLKSLNSLKKNLLRMAPTKKFFVEQDQQAQMRSVFYIMTLAETVHLTALNSYGKTTKEMEEFANYKEIMKIVLWMTTFALNRSYIGDDQDHKLVV